MQNLYARLLFITFFILSLFILFLTPKAYAQPIPPPPILCNEIGIPEFHTYRPYQASPCNDQATELALYCGTSFVLADTSVMEKVYELGDPENTLIGYEYRYDGGPIDPTDPEDEFSQHACNYCSNGNCVANAPPCIPDIGCTSDADCVNNCVVVSPGVEMCTFDIHQERDIAINLEDADFPIMGNTEDVVNSIQDTDIFEDPQKVNEYVSWYLNGVLSNPAEYGLIDADDGTDDEEDVNKIINFSGTLRRLISHKSQRDIISGTDDTQWTSETQGTIQKAYESRYNDAGIRHDQVIGCVNRFTGRSLPCYPIGLGIEKAALRLSDFIDANRLPPREEDYRDANETYAVNMSNWYEDYREWKGDTCIYFTFPPFTEFKIEICFNNPFNRDVFGDLFFSAPFSSTEDRLGLVDVVMSNIQPAQANIRIINAIVEADPADLYFAHMEEDVELFDLLQKTYAPQEGDLAGPVYDISPAEDPFCDLREVRSNPGDDLFATEILAHIEYDAQVDCTYLIPYGEDDAPEGNICENLLGGECQVVLDEPVPQYCETYYGIIDCPPSPFLPVPTYCGQNCTTVPINEYCDLNYPGSFCYPDSRFENCSGIQDDWSFECPSAGGCSDILCTDPRDTCGGRNDNCLIGTICPAEYCPVDETCWYRSCPGGHTCADSCERVYDITDLTEECSSTVNVTLGTITETPKADEAWSRSVAGPMSVFRRVFPKVEPDAPIEGIWDIPAATTVTFTGDGGVVYVGNPGSGRTNPELYFIHIGGIHQYFLKCIQRAIRPEGFGEPCLSGSPGTALPILSCPNPTIPDRWEQYRQAYIDLVSRWTATTCTGPENNLATDCYRYVVSESLAAGVNPAFTLTIWARETGASNYCWGGPTTRDFGIDISSIYQNIIEQLRHFLGLPIASTYISCRGLCASNPACVEPMHAFLGRFAHPGDDPSCGWNPIGTAYYESVIGFAWPVISSLLGRNCLGAGGLPFGIQWPTDMSCP